MRRCLLPIMLVSLVGCAVRSASAVHPSSPSEGPSSQGPLVLRSQLEGLSVALEGEGFRAGDTQIDTFLPQGAREVQRLTVPARTCIALVAIASGAVVDLDAGLYAPEGEALVEDENVDARPVLSLCSGAESRTLYYTLHAYQGGGAVLARSFLRPEGPSDRGLPSATGADLSVWSALVARLNARGFNDDGPATDLDLKAGDNVRVALPATGGDCYTWVGEAEGTLRGVTLRVLDGSGRELARGEDDGGPIAMQLCVARTNELVFIVSAAIGHGKLRLSRFRGPEARVGGPSALWLGEPRSGP